MIIEEVVKLSGVLFFSSNALNDIEVILQVFDFGQKQLTEN